MKVVRMEVDTLHVQNGYVHITLKELPHSSDVAPGKVRLEMGVLDSGKGISKEFLKVCEHTC